MIVCHTYLINTSKSWVFCIMYTNLSIKRNNTCVLCTKPSVRNGRCENSYVLGLLVHGKVVVVCLVGQYSSSIVLYEKYLIWNEHNRTHTSASTFTQTNGCTDSRKHERDVTSK